MEGREKREMVPQEQSSKGIGHNLNEYVLMLRKLLVQQERSISQLEDTVSKLEDTVVNLVTICEEQQKQIDALFSRTDDLT